MAIQYLPEKQQFLLHTAHTTYAMELAQGRYLRHLYYGNRQDQIESSLPSAKSFSPNAENLETRWSPDVLSLEMPFHGSGDFRIDALAIRGKEGNTVTDFAYDSYNIFNGRVSLDGLPAARSDENTETLEIRMTDPVNQCILHLYYTVFEGTDVISRYFLLENNGKSAVRIENCMSLALDIDRCNLDMISLGGGYGRECSFYRSPLSYGIHSIRSARGTSSHHHNPFLAICDHNANEVRGNVYGFNFVYSGCFENEIEVDQQGHTRILMGLGHSSFSYLLEPQERFCSPEAVMTHSSKGINGMTRQFHRFIRDHILPVEAKQPHPVVLNTWEACYFDIDQQMLLQFADEAKELGFDMLVMDDGWFGARNNDRAGLGDWWENRAKFPNGLKNFVCQVKEKGIHFGIWIEPEMVNPDSELFRAHPDWCICVPGRAPMLSRNQLVLDLSNPEVIRYLKDVFSKNLKDIPLDYFKWDMNRHICDVGSPYLPAERQDEVLFRYMKGVYELMGWFREQFPNAVIETCSGGGGRYDLGMMCYGIQIWTSDNTNPNNRTMIQHGALTAYPAATMSCHVSNPKENMRSLEYRFQVAVGGMLGYELNILKMSEGIKEKIREQIALYREFEHLIRLGDYRCLVSPVSHPYSAYAYAGKDGNEILLTVIERPKCKINSTKLLRLPEADRNASYLDRIGGKVYSGEALRRGIRIVLTGEADHAELFYFVKTSDSERKSI